MALFKYVTNPGGEFDYVDAADRNAAATAIGAGNFNATYDFVTISEDDDDVFTPRTDEEIRDVVGATLVAGNNVTIDVDDAGDTITISSSGGGGTPPPTDADRIYYGLSTSSDTTTINVTTLTREDDPTNPDTISTGLTSSGDYFVLFVPMTHDISSIFDTVLQQDVTIIFTALDNAQVVDTIAFKSYIVGPLNAGVNEQYIINF